MKKFLLLFFVLIITSCTTEKIITKEKVNAYNMYGQKIKYIQIQTCDQKLNNGVYYIQIIENDNDSPYWTKVVMMNL
jgi:hypothetical protein